MRRTMAARVKAPGSDIYSLLSSVGRDCIGALQFLPEGQEPEPTGAVTGRAVGDKAIARILKELHGAPLGLDEEGEFRISLAGVQEKTALLWWKTMAPTTSSAAPMNSPHSSPSAIRRRSR